LAGALALILALRTAPAAAEPALPTGFQDAIAFGDLEQPSTFRFSPDHRIFVAEKPGKIEVYDDMEDTEPELFADLRTKVYAHGDRGLLGLVLDPGFPEKPYVYALYTYNHILGDSNPPPKWVDEGESGECKGNGADDCLVSGRLVRLEADPIQNHALPSAAAPQETLLAEGWCQQFSSHSIGDLEFGPEGALYVSGGDGASFENADFGQLGTPANPCGDPPGKGGALRSQNLENVSGKILRIDPADGAAWNDNPLASSPNQTTRKVVAYGFRNPFRFTIDPRTGEIYTGNVGSSEMEEIDRFAAPPPATYNSGWPCYEGPVRQYLFEEFDLQICKDLYQGEPSSTAEPFFYYSHGQSVVPEDECPLEYGSAISGLSFYEGSSFPPEYKGALFFGDSVRGCVWVMFPGADGRPDPQTTERFMREAHIYPGVEIREGPDGALYYADLFGDEESGPGAIHRITYSPGAPTARLSASPPYGTSLPLSVTFDAGGSTDPNGDALSYDWDLDGNGSFETHGGVTRGRIFTEAELEGNEDNEESLNKIVAVRVSDGGHSSVARVTVYPGDKPPAPTIDAPSPSLTWRVGDAIQFKGSALDAEGEHMPGQNLYWSMRIAHCPTGPTTCHKHPLQIFSGLKQGSFLAPSHDYPSYIEITMRAADYRGLTATKTIQIQPRTVALDLESDPAGIGLTAGLLSQPSPFTLTAIEGATEVLSAPQTVRLAGRAYEWQSWSDGGARVHSVIANEPGTYRANYSVLATPAPIAPGSPADEPKVAVRLKGHPAKRTHSTTARFSFGSSQSGTRFACKLDKRRYRSCRSPVVYKDLKPAVHVFAVVAVDANGKPTGGPAKFSWKVLPRK
jgi:glucose/arabinose dehydrogenase